MINILDVSIFSITTFPIIAGISLLSCALIEGRIRGHLRDRKNEIKYVIVEEYKKSKDHWEYTVCPNCKTSVQFWNTGTKDEHPCTVCNKMVVLV